MSAYRTERIWAIPLIAGLCLLSLNYTNDLVRLDQRAYMQIYEVFGFMPELLVEALKDWDVEVIGITLMQSVTHIFLHASLFHFTANIILLYLFGQRVERSLGGFRFLVFYLATGIAASVGSMLFKVDPVSIVGASGAVIATMGAYVAHVFFTRGRTRLDVFVGILGALYVLYKFAENVVLMVYAQSGALTSPVAFDVHVAGFMVGFLTMSVIIYVQHRRNRIRITPVLQTLG
jgi:membrane associated rhomboid family serine protease